MSYLPDYSRSNIDVSTHYFSGESSGYFTYTTPTYTGEGVTRTDSVTFTLAAGRSYLLIGAINMKQASTFNYLDLEHQWEVGGTLAGFKAKVRTAKGSLGTNETWALIRKDPMYRPEAVVFIPSSDITTSVAVKLKLGTIASDGGTSLAFNLNTSHPAAVQIISIPD